MGLPFPSLVYEPCFEVFSRPVTITPLASQPGVAAYVARGIFDTNDIDIEAMEDSFVSSTRTELDILQMEFPVLPMQNDLVWVPDDQNVPGGEFVISDVAYIGNAGGEVTLVLKRLMLDRLIGTAYSLGAPDVPSHYHPALGWSYPTLTVGSNNFSLSFVAFDMPWLDTSRP